ncbi:MAG: DNA-binding protein WhiA [Lachnospiraceae bacterium]|nr:DNA-binding protein WhiA [Lachnospiraceae bacterium]MDD3795628.1 DNA-binding protein WhiA [Lachnospiraceae bacterium]
MSFSSEVKEELSRQLSSARHCQIAEVTAIISMCGRVSISTRDKVHVKITTENISVARKYFTLLKKTFNINGEVSVKIHGLHGQNSSYSVTVKEHGDALRVLMAARLVKQDLDIAENMSLVDNMIVQKSCCRRAFIRGAFLVAGSISDPEKFYHFEIVCATMPKAVQLQEMLLTFELDAKIVQRKTHYVVYIKEGAQIVDALNVMEAHVALMNLENIRIVRDVRNTVNRKVNCETANINKTVNAAVKQIEDIEYLQEHLGLDKLPDNLADMAELRLEQRESTLKELGMMLTPAVGKSGVNHRLRKLSQIAEKLRQNKEDYYD